MSRVEVNKIQQQCGTTLTVGGGACKTAVVDATTVTLGRCGATVSLASGATQSGFGRTGTVDWVTTVKVTGDSPITAVTGEGYFLNTTAGAITVNLPAGAAGSIVSLADYAGTWETYNLTIAPNGAEKIGGTAEDVILSTNGQSVTLVYIDGTQGWVTTADSTENVQAIKYVTATGGTPCAGAIVCTNYKVHTFTGPGTFCVSCAGNPAGSYQVDYMVVAGGGAGGTDSGGGGGAGGFRESGGAASGCYTVSPLGTAVAALSVPVAPYPIAVGAGGNPVCGSGLGSGVVSNPGNVSTFSTITSTGGGRGGSNVSSHPNPIGEGGDGGAGGGASWCQPGGGTVFCGGTGNTPIVAPAQGFPGGDGRHLGPSYASQGGGGGATVQGTDQAPGSPPGKAGGAGATTSISASPTVYGGGGGGSIGGAAGPGGGGAGSPPGPTTGVAGTCNTGGGGGGAGTSGTSGAGGSGVVIIRYKFQ